MPFESLEKVAFAFEQPYILKLAMRMFANLGHSLGNDGVPRSPPMLQIYIRSTADSTAVRIQVPPSITLPRLWMFADGIPQLKRINEKERLVSTYFADY